MTRLGGACLLLAAAAVSCADAPAGQVTHELVIFDSNEVKEQDVIDVLKGFGYQEQHWKPILEALSKSGERGVVGAHGSETGIGKVKKALEGIGMKSKIRVKAVGAYGESDVVEVTTSEDLEKLIKSAEPTLLKFYGSNCAACHAMIPEYKAAATELKDKGVTVAAVNLQLLPEAKAIGDNLGITVLPTIRFVVSGDFLETSARTKDALVAFAVEANAQAAKGVESRPAGEAQPQTNAATENAEKAEASSHAESKIGLSKVNQPKPDAQEAPAAAA